MNPVDWLVSSHELQPKGSQETRNGNSKKATKVLGKMFTIPHEKLALH